jgi:hypothetical protein
MVYITISWKDLVKMLVKYFWYEVYSQRWSHIKIKYFDWTALIIPDHKQLKEWLFNALLSQIWNKFWKTKLEVFNELFGKK